MFRFAVTPVRYKCLQSRVHVHCVSITTVTEVLDDLQALLPSSLTDVRLGA